MHFTVVIPTRNRGHYLAALLDSLALQEPVRFAWEVLVVDNGSTDRTPDVVAERQARLPITIRMVREERPGLHAGRHRGAEEARGALLAYLDDDMTLSSHWIRGANLILNNGADAVVGRILPIWSAAPPPWLSNMIGSGGFGYLSLLDLGETVQATHCFYGCNLFLAKKTLYELRGFHPDGMPESLLRYRGDGETGLWLKFRDAGLRLRYEPAALAYHLIPQERTTLKYLRRRAYQQGISDSFTAIRSSGTPTRAVSSLERAARCLKSHFATCPSAWRAAALAHAWYAGFCYHQDAVRRDKALLEWTMRVDYLRASADIGRCRERS